MATRQKSIDWQAYKSQILAELDLRQEFGALGIDLAGEPGEDGWAPCRAIDREDNTPSAAVNVLTGHYVDKGGVGLSLSFWDLCVSMKRFARWQDARDHYAAKSGITCDRKPPRDPAEHLEFQPWRESIVALWCRHKPGITPESVQAAGGRVARYRGQYTVVALPIYGPGLLDAEPAGWVLYNSTGRELPIFSRGKNNKTATAWKKMKTTGGSESGLIGRHALGRLRDDPAAEFNIWKVEGPSDLLALWAFMPTEFRDRHLILTNAGGANEHPRQWMAFAFAGRRVVVVHDCDYAGQGVTIAGQAKNDGANRWRCFIAAVAAETRWTKLPYEVVPDHGRDLRDWICEE